MTEKGSLEGLKDIFELESVGFWPLAPGWIIILAALMIGLFYLSAVAIIRYRRNSYRRKALKELSQIILNPKPCLRDIPILVKKTAVNAYSLDLIAPLNGKEWLSFLNRTCPSLNDSDLSLLPILSYQPDEVLEGITQGELKTLFDSVRKWILEHQKLEEQIND